MSTRKPRDGETPPEPHPGLCTTCGHSRYRRGRRSLFVLCELAAIDRSFPRYPRLPVLDCRGYLRK